jgi:hypothetical protein
MLDTKRNEEAAELHSTTTAVGSQIAMTIGRPSKWSRSYDSDTTGDSYPTRPLEEKTIKLPLNKNSKFECQTSIQTVAMVLGDETRRCQLRYLSERNDSLGSAECIWTREFISAFGYLELDIRLHALEIEPNVSRVKGKAREILLPRCRKCNRTTRSSSFCRRSSTRQGTVCT